jgi:AcrR family transcriptional regulator
VTADSRRRLQEAALELFERRGFDAVTIDDIAAAAATSRSTYFRHFATKEDAALGDHAERVELFGELLARPRAAGSTTFDQVLEAARTVLATIWADPGFYRQRYRLIFGTPVLRQRMHVCDRAFIQFVTDVIRAEFPDPRLGALHARMLAAAGIELVNAVLEQWASDPHTDADELFATGAEDLRRAALAWAGGGAGETSVVIVARTDLSAAEIRRRLEPPAAR